MTSLRVIRVCTVLLGLTAVAIGGVGFWFGNRNPAFGVHDLADPAKLDTALRYFAGLWLAIGLAALWISSRLERERTLFVALWGMVFLGGVGRVISLVTVGSPGAMFLFFMCVELLASPALIVWHGRITSRVSAA
jgi:Domain of unknown function (DUF4345)